MDRRKFDREAPLSRREMEEARIRSEYVLLSLRTPITGVTNDLVLRIANNTGIDEITIERYLLQNFPRGDVSNFFSSYKELANMGRPGASEFELATCELFRNIFHMEAEHVGPKGNTPDVLVKSEELGFCGIIDNKSYSNGYSISGNHKRVMEMEYIHNYRSYGHTELPLAFFSYIGGSFGSSINSQIMQIVSDTGVNGSAMPVDILISIAQDYIENEYDHAFIKRVFSVGREVRLSDITCNHEG